MRRLPESERALEEALPHFTVRYFDEVTSTMEEARKIAPEINKGGIVIANSQNSGRGTRGREWLSPPGGFYATYIFRAQAETSLFGGFSLAVGLSIIEALEVSNYVKLKWPNDLYSLDRRKLGGILIELEPSDTGCCALIGVGLNLVRGELPKEINSFEEITGQKFSPLDVATLLARRFESMLPQYHLGGFAQFGEEFTEHAMLLGEEIDIQVGDVIQRGRFLFVDSDGALVLGSDKGETRIVSGRIQGFDAARL